METFYYISRGLFLLAVSAVFSMLWLIKSDIADLQKDVAVQNTELKALTKNVALTDKHLDTFRSMVSDRYTGEDATRDLGIINAVTADHERRIRIIEREHIEARKNFKERNLR